MIYLEYERLKKKYRKTQAYFQDVLDEKERLFQKTQPQSMSFDQDRVYGGIRNNKADTYMIEIEKLDDQLKVAESMLAKRMILIKAKEKELRMSRNTEDMVYCLKFLDRLKTAEIAGKLCYSEISIRRYLKKISENIKMIENDTFICDII